MKVNEGEGNAIPERGQRMLEQLLPPAEAYMMKPHLPRMGPRQIGLKEGRN